MTNPECQVPCCEKYATKEVHLFVKVNRKHEIFLCEEHFKKIERSWANTSASYEVYDLTPPEPKEKVEFT